MLLGEVIFEMLLNLCGFAAVCAVAGAIIFAGIWLIHKIYVAFKERAHFEDKLRLDMFGVRYEYSELEKKIESFMKATVAQQNTSASEFYKINCKVEKLDKGLAQLQKCT